MRLAEYMEREGLNQTTFAKRLGLSQPYLSRWLGGAEPSIRHALLVVQESKGAVGLLDLLNGPVPAPVAASTATAIPLRGLPTPDTGPEQHHANPVQE